MGVRFRPTPTQHYDSDPTTPRHALHDERHVHDSCCIPGRRYPSCPRSKREETTQLEPQHVLCICARRAA
eukprot:5670054-Pyramimonas_sp.AAC.1